MHAGHATVSGRAVHPSTACRVLVMLVEQGVFNMRGQHA